MEKSIISEGKTTAEAVENGLKILNISKNKVDIKVLEEEKKSFFSILAPRKVRVELTLRENLSIKSEKTKISKKDEKTSEKSKENKINTKKDFKISDEEIEKAKENLDIFLEKFVKTLPTEDLKYTFEYKENRFFIEINSQELGYLIGYRGESMRALEIVLCSIASKNIEHRILVSLDIEKYKEKRTKSLENLAVKVAEGVLKTKKDRKLEPMIAYERKVIHSKLQEIPNIETRSVGEEPNRKIIVSYKNS